MSDRTLDILFQVACLTAIGAFWPLLKVWLSKHGMPYRSMKEQREYEANLERERAGGTEPPQRTD